MLARRTGTEVPAAMQPILQQTIDAGAPIAINLSGRRHPLLDTDVEPHSSDQIGALITEGHRASGTLNINLPARFAAYQLRRPPELWRI